MSNINHEYRHVHVHTPKTAGTSMLREGWVRGSNHRPARRLLYEDHAPRDYFWWGFVRHPCDRLISIYHAALKYGNHYPHCQEAGSFERWVMTLEDHWKKMPHTHPMTHFLCRDDDGTDVLVEFIGRFERLEEDWRRVWEAVRPAGHPFRPLRKTNSTEHPSWQDVFTSRMKRVVERLYRADLELFGYSTKSTKPLLPSGKR